MKVLFLTTVPSPYRVDFFECLGGLCELTVLYESRGVSYREKDWMKTQAKNYKSIYLKGKNIKGKFIPTNLKKLLFQKNYDVFVVSGYSTIADILAIQYLKKKKKSFILSCDGALLKEENFLKYSLKKKLISSANHWLSTGNITNEYLLHYGAQKDSIYFYPFSSIHNNEISDEIIGLEDKKSIRSKLKMREKKILLTVGQYIHRKGIDVLLETSNKLSQDYGVYIVGGEPTSEYLKYVNDHKLTNVHFVSFKSTSELREYYKAADLFVLPTREDIWGLVVNEAMAVGLPVITTDRCVAGVELIKEGINGYIVPIEDNEALANAINSYYEKPEKHLRMSSECLKSISPYTIENMAEYHFKIFKEIHLKEKI